MASARVSRLHEHIPYVLHAGGCEYRVAYTPAESDSRMFGGNSNWRGPIWMPMNVLLIRALQQFHATTATTSRGCPTGSGRRDDPLRGREGDSHRLHRIFLRDEHGRASGLRRYAMVPAGPALARPCAGIEETRKPPGDAGGSSSPVNGDDHTGKRLAGKPHEPFERADGGRAKARPPPTLQAGAPAEGPNGPRKGVKERATRSDVS